MSRNIEMRAELLGENKSGGAFADFVKDVESADAALSKLDGRDVTATLRLDDRSSADVAAAGKRLDAFDGREATATLSLRDDASADAERAAARVDAFGRQTASATLGLDDRASAEVKDAERAVVRFGSVRATATADLDDSGVTRGVAAAAGKVSSLARLRPSVRADWDDAAVTRGAASTAAKATAVGRLRPTVTADFDGAAATAGLVAYSGTAVGATGATQALTKSMVGLTSPVALGGVAAGAVAAAAAVGPLAAGLAIAGTAGVAAASGFGLLVGAIAGPIVEIQKFKEAQKEQAAATEAAATAAKGYEAAQASLADAQRGVTAAERGVADARRQAAEGVAEAQEGYRDALRGVSDAQREVRDSERGVHEAVRGAADAVREAEEGYEEALRGVADAQREVKAAERGVHEAQREAARGVAEAEADYEDALRGVADAQREVKAAERGVHEAQREAAEGVASAEDDYRDALRGVAAAQREVATAERGVAEARRGAARQTADATETVVDAREELEDSTASLAAAQRDLNAAERAEPLNQAEATLDLADARDRASDAQREYNKAVREYGRSSEEATDAARDLERAELDLKRTGQEVRETRKKGSDELRSAQEGARDAYDSQKDAAEGVSDAERDLARARRAGAREVREAQRGVAQAQRGVAQAQRDALAAERAIAVARRDGARQVRDAQRAVADAQRGVAEAQREAVAAERGIARARAEGARQVREAQRGVAEAQRALADSQRDALRAEREISRARAEGARGVREAQRQVAESQRALADSQRAAAKAEKEISRARAEGARQVRDAQRGVADAQRQAARAADELADAAKEVAAKQREAAGAGGALSAANRKLLDSFEDLGPAYRRSFRGANREAADLGAEILGVAKGAMPALGREAEETVRGARRAFSGLRNDLGGREKDSLNRILDSSSDIIGDLLRAGGRTFGGLANVIAEIVPDAKSFSRYLSDVSEDFLKWSRTKGARDDIRDWVKDAKPLFKELAENAGDFIGFLVKFGNRHADELVEGLDLVTDSLDALFGGKEQKAREQDAKQAGRRSGKFYGGSFADANSDAAKEEGPGVGERWGELIGKGVGKGVASLVDWNKVGRDPGEGFVSGFAKGALGELRDIDWKDAILAGFRGLSNANPANRLVEGVQDELDDLAKWIGEWGPDALKRIMSPFTTAYDKIVGNSIVPDLADDVTRVFDKLPGRIGDALSSLPGKVGGIFEDAYKRGSGVMGDLAKSADTKTDAARESIQNHLETARDKGKAALDVLRRDGIPDLDGLRKGADEKMGDARAAIKGHLENARDVGKSALEVLRDKGGEAMSEARDRYRDPVGAASLDMQGFMNNMLYGMGQVIDKAGLDLKKPTEFTPREHAQQNNDRFAGRYSQAEGGIITPNGPLRFAAGGDFRADGGDLRAARQPRLIEFGEGDHDEAAIFITKNPSLRPNQERYMRKGADLIGGAFLSAAELQAREIRSYARGGMVRLGDGLFAEIEEKTGGEGRTRPGSPERELFGERWAAIGAGGSAGGALPPRGTIGAFFGPDGILRYEATPEAAQLAAAGAKMWRGQVRPGTGGSRVRMGELGGSIRGLAYDSGEIVLDHQAQGPASAHEFGHHFELGHGGDSIMGGAGYVTDNDFTALREYHGIEAGGRRRRGHRGDTGPGGVRSYNSSQRDYDDSGISLPDGMRLSDLDADARRAINDPIFTGGSPRGLAGGGVIPGVPIWRRRSPEAEAEARRAEEVLRNPPIHKMGRLVPPGTNVGSGEGLGPEMHTYAPEMQKFVSAAEKKFPDTYTNTYSNHPMGYEQPHFRERSVDFWGPGFRGDPIPTATGDKVVAHAIDELAGDLNWLIFNGKMLDAGGWGPDTSGFSHAGKQAHVHITAFADHSTVSGDATAAGGSSGIDIAPMIDRYIKDVPDWGHGLPKDSAEGIARTARAAIVKQLEAEAAKMSGGGGSFGSAEDLRGWVEAGLKVDDLFPANETNVQGYMDLAQTESSGDPEAVQQITDVNSTMGGAGGFDDNLARGLLQNTPQSWEGNRKRYGKDPGQADPNIFDPVKSVAMRARNQKAALGEISFTPGYRGGGWITKDHPAMVHKDELYLDIGKDPRAATAFVGFLKNLVPRGFDSGDMREEYRRRIESLEDRGAAGGVGGRGGGLAGGEGPAGDRAARKQRDETNDRLRRLEDAMERYADRTEDALSRVEGATRDVGPDVRDGVKHQVEEDPEMRRSIREGQEKERVFVATGGERFGARR